MSNNLTHRYTADNFRLLRTALVRGLVATCLSETQYTVTSYSTPGKKHFVSTSGICSCEATKGCTHAALVLDRWMESDADTCTYRAYGDAHRDDQLALSLRIQSGELSRDDKEYLKFCVRKVEQSRPWLVREVAPRRTFDEATTEHEDADAMVVVSRPKGERLRGFTI